MDVDLAGGNDYVLVIDMESLVQTQINFSGDADFMAWSTDGTELLLEVDSHLEIVSPTGSGVITSYATREDLSSFDASPDKAFVIYVDHPAQGFGSLRKFSLADSADVLFHEGLLTLPRISPDGKFVAFSDSEFNVFVKEIDGDGFYLASRDVSLARRPVWSPNGDFLYFDANPNLLVRIPISLTNGFTQLSRVEEIAQFSSSFEFDISNEGEILALTAGAPGANISGNEPAEFRMFRYDVTVNWFEELKALAPKIDR